MSFANNNTNGTGGLPTTVVEPPEPIDAASIETQDHPNWNEASPPKFATRADARAEGVSKGKLMLLGGGLAVAVLFFVFTAVVGKSPKKVTAVKPSSQLAKQEQATLPKDSVTPVMDMPRTQAPDNTSGQLGPGDIRRTRSLDDAKNPKPFAAKPAVASSLGSVPSFADTQRKWEDPPPYNGAPPAEIPQGQQNTLKEASLVFVRSPVQNQTGMHPR